MNVVIRRRAGLMAFIAVVAVVFGAAYLWRFIQTQSGAALALGLLLGVVAVAHALAWGDARTPLLVADDLGLRVRLGGDWTGLTWDLIDTIEVDERGRLTDGHVAVLAADPAAALAQANLRSRMGARFNRFVYDAPLVVPFGLTTTVSVADVSAALSRLADGRAPVIVLGETEAEPEPTVEVTAATTTAPASAVQRPGRQPTGDGPTGDGPSGDKSGVVAEDSPRPFAAQSLPVPDRSQSPAGTSRRLPWAMPRLPLPGRRSEVAAHAAPGVSALKSHPARREEVTMPTRREPATDGTLALTEAYDETEPLPEIQELRRGRDDEQTEQDNRGQGNIPLIIDATTDLSARAMRKVRRPLPEPPATDMASESELEGRDFDEPLVIGGLVSEARRRLGLSIDELADRTRIRPFVIESIEVDDFGPCGGDFYARGHLRMLGRVLGIDPEPLVAAYDKEFAAQPINARTVFDVELAAGTTGMVRGGAPGSNWGALIAAVLVIMLIWGLAQYFTTRQQDALVPPPQRSQNSAGLGSPGPGNRPLVTPEASVTVSARGGYSRVLVTDGDREVIFRGLLSEGQSRRVTGVAPLHVTARNGGVVALRLDGRQPKIMGEKGLKAQRTVRAPR